MGRTTCLNIAVLVQVWNSHTLLIIITVVTALRAEENDVIGGDCCRGEIIVRLCGVAVRLFEDVYPVASCGRREGGREEGGREGGKEGGREGGGREGGRREGAVRFSVPLGPDQEQP